MLEQDDYFDARELGLDELNPRISVNISEHDVPGMVTAVVEVQEDLRFHSELEEKYPSDPRIFQEDGSLTEDAFNTLSKIIQERYKGVDVQEHGGDFEDRYISFELVLDVPETTGTEDLGTLIWESTALVQFHNEADPGTFGSPYLFGTLITDARWEAEHPE